MKSQKAKKNMGGGHSLNGVDPRKPLAKATTLFICYAVRLQHNIHTPTKSQKQKKNMGGGRSLNGVNPRKPLAKATTLTGDLIF